MASKGSRRYSDSPPVEGTTSRGHPATVHMFRGEGVTVKVPHHNARGKKGRPAAKEFGIIKDEGDPKKPGRLVINLGVEDPDEEERFVNHFDPPFELRVKITEADERRARERGEQVRLLYWDVANRRWEPFPQDWVRRDGDEIEVAIPEWADDPPVGTGP